MARRQRLDPNQIPLIVPDSTWEVPKELPALTGVKEFALDTEDWDEGLQHGRGPGWVYGAGYLAGISVTWREDRLKSVYVPLRHPETQNFDKGQVTRWLRELVKKRNVVFFNAGFDIGWLIQDGYLDKCPDKIDDASCMAFMIDENRYDFSLDGTAKWCNIPGKNTKLIEEAARTYGYADWRANIAKIPARYVGPYGEGDSESTLLMAEHFRPELARQGLMTAYGTEMRLVPLIHAMRKKGIRLDIDRLERFETSLIDRRDKVLAELSSRLRQRVGMDEIRSHKWLYQAFYQEKVPFNEKEGKASFEKDWMRRGTVERNGKPHWLPMMIAEAKQCSEAAEKFVRGYLLDFAHNGRVHASINQFRTEEGGTRSQRFSYADPPLQQMPSRPDPIATWLLTELIAKELRCSFLPDEGEYWFAPDYSQQEYRLIVDLAEKLGCRGAERAADMYRNNPKTDFHNLVVELTGLTRRQAKDVNFAKAFGAGIPKFAIMTNMTFEDAESTMNQYDKEMPFVKEAAQLCEKSAQRNGYIRLVDGARAHFDDWEAAWLSKEERDAGWRSHRPMAPARIEEAQRRTADENHPWYGKRLKRSHTHKAMNRRIQGSAARQMKIAMAGCWEEGIMPMLQMHDELAFSLPLEKKLQDRVVEIMVTAIKTNVPFIVDAEWGPSWGEAKLTFDAVVASTKAQPKGAKSATTSAKTARRPARPRAS